MSKTLFLSLIAIAAIALVGSLIWISGSSAPMANNSQTVATSIPAGNQVLTIAAKGGFSPQSSTLKAGQPTSIKFTTKNTFDCSSTIVIKSLGITKTLAANGETVVEIPAQKAGSVIKGTCSMGMYSFDITFA
jgi:P-type Cu+ transporter